MSSGSKNKKAGRKSNNDVTWVVYQDYKIKIEDNSYVLYKVDNPHALGYYTDMTYCIKSIIEDNIRNKRIVIELQDFLNLYREMKDEILGLLS